LSAKAVERRVPLGAAVAASFGLDLLWPVLLIAGVETVAIHPGDTAFTNLEFVSYPWSHSLLAVAGWSVLATLLAARLLGSSRAGVVLGALVASHWCLDFLTHRPDLPIWPGGPVVGLGLWSSIASTIVIEGGLLATGVWLYTTKTIARDGVGRWALVGLLALTTTIWITQPWSPPPPTAEAVGWGGLVMWLLPLWAWWIERHRIVGSL
jgi:hypothetical protein